MEKKKGTWNGRGRKKWQKDERREREREKNEIDTGKDPLLVYSFMRSRGVGQVIEINSCFLVTDFYLR